MIKFIQEQYPPGTRIRLNFMNDPYAPITPGTEGVVDVVDDDGQLHMKWDNGRTLALISVSIGCVIGALVAILRLGKSKVLRAVATVYTEVIRDTPLLLQLYFFYFLLPDILPALKLSKFACITIALVINSGAYMSEVFRSGIQSIDRGQTEAARSLGLSARQTMMRIILPQAFKNVLPAMCNEFVAVTKETSLASTFYVGDLMTQYQTISGKTYLVIEPLVIIGVIYFVVTFSMSKLITVLERRLKNDD